MGEDKKDRVRGEGTAFFSVSAFPKDLWGEWNKDCQDRFGDCRWIKMWNDHTRVKDVDRIDRLEEKILVLEKIIDKMINMEPKEEKKTVKTFTQELEEK